MLDGTVIRYYADELSTVEKGSVIVAPDVLVEVCVSNDSLLQQDASVKLYSDFALDIVLSVGGGSVKDTAAKMTCVGLSVDRPVGLFASRPGGLFPTDRTWHLARCTALACLRAGTGG